MSPKIVSSHYYDLKYFFKILDAAVTATINRNLPMNNLEAIGFSFTES